MTRCTLYVVLLGVQVVCATSTVFGQNYPNKTVRIVTGDVGGGTDLTSRLIAQEISNPLGQQVIVENRPTVVAIESVAKAAPDGYSMLLQGNIIWTGPLLQKMSYDPVADFSPVTLAAIAPQVLVVHPSLPANSVKELIALAKAKPGGLNYAATGIGGVSHLVTELFNDMAGVKIARVNYKGQGAAVRDLISGEIQLMFASATTVSPYVKAGRLRALAVTTAQPSALTPGLPTVAAAGLRGYDAGTIYAIFVPARTPEVIVKRLNQEIVRALQGAEVKKRFFNEGVETVGSSPEQLAAAVKADTARMAKVIKDAGIKVE